MNRDPFTELVTTLEEFVANLRTINGTTPSTRVPVRSEKRDVVHGANRYSTYKCRCPICRAAKVEANRQYRARALKDGRITHGAISGYTVGCRCNQCITAGRTYQASRPPRKR